jgi:hypothetical protein
LALAVFAFCFGLFGLTASSFVGYEGETAATAEGFVKTGHLRPMKGSPLVDPISLLPYSRTGLTQPLLEAPFYALGNALDGAASGGRNYSFRLEALDLYNPFMAAVAAAAVFGLVLLRRGSTRWALVLALLFACASIVWPYSKIGMETTAMALVVAAFFLTTWAARSQLPFAYLAAGVATGAMAAAKPYILLIVPAVAVLAWQGLRVMPSTKRWRFALLFTVPVVAWAAAIAWYNWYRTGSVTDFNNPYSGVAPLSAPLNALGLFLSPGKGLVLFSPLIALGVCGLPGLWKTDRFLAIAILVAVAGNTAVIALTPFWGDETWGPRYLVPVAGLLLLPIAWWAHSRRRKRVVAAFAAVAVAVQMLAVFVTYPAAVKAQRELTREPVYPIGLVGKTPALGNDGPRWIPELSQLLVQTEVVTAWATEQVTGSGFTVVYHPYEGPRGQSDMTHPAAHFHTTIPDVLWHPHGPPVGPAVDRGSATVFRMGAVLLALVGAFAGSQLIRATRRLTPDEVGASGRSVGSSRRWRRS